MDNYPPNHIDEVDVDDDMTPYDEVDGKALARAEAQPTLEEKHAWILTPLEREANRQILKYAVQRTMFHDCCGTIADVRRSILFEAEGHGGHGFKLYCPDCVEAGAGITAAVTKLESLGFEVTVYDGKELWS